MNNYAVLGLGLMGEALCYDLLNYSNNFVYAFELNDNRRKEIEKKFEKFEKKFSTQNLNLTITDRPEEDLLVKNFLEKGITVVFGAIDYKFNEYLTKVCIKAKASFLDLGGNPEIVALQKKLTNEAKQSNVTIIPDCGLAPGMANVIAAHILDQFEVLDECHIRVGGLPQNPKTILNYQQVFSIRGLTNEYLEDAFVIRNNKIELVESLTELEKIEFPKPFGILEAFQTAGGTSSLPELYENKIKELTYKTIRFPGHCQFFKFLKDFELLTSNPWPKDESINVREVVEYYLEKNLPKFEPDVVLVRVTVIGSKNGKKTKITYDLIDFFDNSTGYSAMARTTAFPISIIGQMIMNDIITTKGVHPGEIIVPKELFLEELSKRKIIFSIQEV